MKSCTLLQGLAVACLAVKHDARLANLTAIVHNRSSRCVKMLDIVLWIFRLCALKNDVTSEGASGLLCRQPAKQGACKQTLMSLGRPNASQKNSFREAALAEGGRNLMKISKPSTSIDSIAWLCRCTQQMVRISLVQPHFLPGRACAPCFRQHGGQDAG